MKKSSLRSLTFGALVAALYVVLTYLSFAFGLASGPVQCRLSEALCILPAFSFSAVPGLFVGCVLSNLLTGASLLDILFGSLATLLGALGAYCLRKRVLLAPLPTVLANALILPPVLLFAAFGEITPSLFFLYAGEIAVGELLSAFLLGLGLYRLLHPYRRLFTENGNET